MAERTLLTVFFTCLAGCASIMLANFWLGERVLPQIFFKFSATFFIVGLACFLTWFVQYLLSIRALLGNSRA